MSIINHKIINGTEFKKSVINGVEIKLCRLSSSDYKSHVHNELSIGYIIDGSTQLSFADTIIHFNKGDGVIIPPFTTHKCSPNDVNTWSYIMLYIDTKYYKNEIEFTHPQNINGSKLTKLIEFIRQLLDEQDPLMLETILVELLIDFGDSLQKEENLSHEDLIEKTYHYILANVYNVLSLDILQDVSGLNKFTLIRNFKKKYQTTPAAFHLQARVSEAKTLLSKGENVLDICNRLHFYDQSHLIREFKKMYDITPSLYLVQIK